MNLLSVVSLLEREQIYKGILFQTLKGLHPTKIIGSGLGAMNFTYGMTRSLMSTQKAFQLPNTLKR